MENTIPKIRPRCPNPECKKNIFKAYKTKISSYSLRNEKPVISPVTIVYCGFCGYTIGVLPR